MDGIVNMHYVINAVVFSGLGLIVFVLGFVLLDIITPKVSIWKELVEKQNIAVAIFLAGVVFSIATIIASAIHG
jgi:uncharacterized membrane protein YjfL (UPF0719 family)